MINRRHFTLAAAMMPLAFPTFAQTAKKGPNGGLVAGAAGHEVELVVSGVDVSVYVLDDGKVSPVGKAQLRLVVQSGGKTTNVTLATAAPNRLAAKLAEPLAAGAVVVVSGKDDHNHTVSARFTP
jgi:hypothetical protein